MVSVQRRDAPTAGRSQHAAAVGWLVSSFKRHRVRQRQLCRLNVVPGVLSSCLEAVATPVFLRALLSWLADSVVLGELPTERTIHSDGVARPEVVATKIAEQFLARTRV